MDKCGHLIPPVAPNPCRNTPYCFICGMEINNNYDVKPSLDSRGAAIVQGRFYTLTPEERAATLALLREDFSGWLLNSFDLTPSQKVQLEEMPAELKKHIGDQIAECWEHAGLVTFQKEEDEEEEDDRQNKDFIIFPSAVQRYSFRSKEHTAAYSLSIWIRYS